MADGVLADGVIGTTGTVSIRKVALFILDVATSTTFFFLLIVMAIKISIAILIIDAILPVDYFMIRPCVGKAVFLPEKATAARCMTAMDMRGVIMAAAIARARKDFF